MLINLKMNKIILKSSTFMLIFLSSINCTIQNEINKNTLEASTCSFKLTDGKTIDLSSLDKASSPRSFVSGGFTYKFNPCSPINCGIFSTSAICQVYNPDPTSTFNLGDQSSVSFDSSSTTLTYKAVQSGTSRTSNLKCVCGTSESFRFIREQPGLNPIYFLEFQSKCCCPDGCESKPSGGGSSGLSFGSILLIIGVVLLIVYLVGGVIFMTFVKKQTGVQMMPNSSFWLAVPGNIKEGFVFVLRKVKPNGGYQSV